MSIRTFDLEAELIGFWKDLHPTPLRATLTQDWYHEPNGHMKELLTIHSGNDESVVQGFMQSILAEPSFKKFVLDPKYELHGGAVIPWHTKRGITFWRRRRYLDAWCGVEVDFGPGSSKYVYTIRLEEI